MSKVFVYLDNWYEDFDWHGTSVVTVANELREELALVSDKVEEWEIGPRKSCKVSEYWREDKKWVKQL